MLFLSRICPDRQDKPRAPSFFIVSPCGSPHTGDRRLPGREYRIDAPTPSATNYSVAEKACQPESRGLFGTRLMLHPSLFSVGGLVRFRSSKSVRRLAARTCPPSRNEPGIPTVGTTPSEMETLRRKEVYLWRMLSFAVVAVRCDGGPGRLAKHRSYIACRRWPLGGLRLLARFYAETRTPSRSRKSCVYRYPLLRRTGETAVFIKDQAGSRLRSIWDQQSPRESRNSRSLPVARAVLAGTGREG